MWQIIEGDCLNALRGMADASVDAVVCDPPAGISFMGKTWDHNHGGRVEWVAAFAAIFAECLRVVKPGGHAFVWALPRTSHWTACALEDAGWDIRDIVHHLFGSGFPKSLNIGKAIDGAIGTQAHRFNAAGDKECCKVQDKSFRADYGYQYAPATPAAQQWDGWGTALKPAAEHWILARKPIAGTVAANVQQYGTGALNIAAARVGIEMLSAHGGGQNVDGRKYGGGKGIPSIGRGMNEHIGRWPANLVLSHAPGCVKVGTKRVKGIKAPTPSATRPGKREQWRMSADYEPVGYADADGLEMVDAWECVEGCPVKALGEQSGVSKGSPLRPPSTRRRNNGIGLGSQDERFGSSNAPDQYGDTGTAARFFTNLEPSPLDDVTPFLYTAKASRREREAGLEGMAQGANRINAPRSCEAEKFSPTRNPHPTVKPVALMRWLVKLITPPGGIVLDPFAGSGTTGIACVLDGFDFVGIEQDADYCEIARRRIAHWEREAMLTQPTLLDMTGD